MENKIKVEEALKKFLGFAPSSEELARCTFDLSDADAELLTNLVISWLQHKKLPLPFTSEHSEGLTETIRIAYTLGYFRRHYELERLGQ